jgi:hypothetical protein
VRFIMPSDLSDKLRQHRAGLALKEKISLGKRPFHIDLDNGSAAMLGHMGQGGRGLDHGRCPDHEHGSAVLCFAPGGFQGIRGKRFAKKDGVGFEHAAAFAARGHALGDVGRPVFLAALHAENFPQAPVQLNYIPGSGLAVQTVNVLGDDLAQQAQAFELGKGEMAWVGLVGVVVADELAADAPVFGRVLAEDFDRGVDGRVELLPEPALGAEGGDSRFGADAGACQRDAGLMARNQIGNPTDHRVQTTAPCEETLRYDVEAMPLRERAGKQVPGRQPRRAAFWDAQHTDKYVSAERAPAQAGVGIFGRRPKRPEARQCFHRCTCWISR